MGEGGGTSASDAMWLQGYELIFGPGVYKFASHNGLPYIGRTKDIWRRIQEHVRSGRLDPEDIDSIEFVEMTVSRPNVFSSKTGSMRREESSGLKTRSIPSLEDTGRTMASPILLPPRWMRSLRFRTKTSTLQVRHNVE